MALRPHSPPDQPTSLSASFLSGPAFSPSFTELPAQRTCILSSSVSSLGNFHCSRLEADTLRRSVSFSLTTLFSILSALLRKKLYRVMSSEIALVSVLT